jgi:hypothetical protein
MAIGGIKIAFLPNPERVEWVKPLQGWTSPHWIDPHFLRGYPIFNPFRII